MLLYPEVLREAREELDRVIGRGRLPDFTDRDSLPYITAIVKETLRFVVDSYNNGSILILMSLIKGGTLSHL